MANKQVSGNWIAAYQDWVAETYGRTKIEHALNVTESFVNGLEEGVFTGAIDIAEMVVKFYNDPVQTTQEALESLKQLPETAKYFYNNPEQMGVIARHTYESFAQMTPEDKANTFAVFGIQPQQAEGVGNDYFHKVVDESKNIAYIVFVPIPVCVLNRNRGGRNFFNHFNTPWGIGL